MGHLGPHKKRTHAPLPSSYILQFKQIKASCATLLYDSSPCTKKIVVNLWYDILYKCILQALQNYIAECFSWLKSIHDARSTSRERHTFCTLVIMTILTRRGSFGFRNGIRRGWHKGRARTRYPDARYETSGAVVLGASRSLIAPRVAAKRSLIKFYCAGIKLTGRLAGTSGYGLDKWFIRILDTTRDTYTRRDAPISSKYARPSNNAPAKKMGEKSDPS